MNKFLTKIATAMVGIAMAVGVGVSIGLREDARVARAGDVTDVLTKDTFAATGSTYTTFTGKKATSDAVYAGCSSVQNGGIGLKSGKSTGASSNNIGIVTTTSGGTVKSIDIVWKSTTARTLNVYGKNEAYTASTDLYNSTKRGDSIGSFTYGGSTSLTVEGDYEYIGFIASSSSMLSLTSITIVWGTSTTKTVELSYNLNGGSGAEAPSSVEVEENTSTNLAALPAGVTKPGYTFGGWSDGANTYAAGASYTVGSSDVEMLAVWNENADHGEVVGISVDGDMTTLTYLIGDDWSVDGLTVYAEYEDGFEGKDITSLVEWSFSVNGSTYESAKETAGSYSVIAVANYEDTIESDSANQTVKVVEPMSVTEARNHMGENGQYVVGVVCTVPTSISSGQLSYYISDDGTTTNNMQVYKGKDLNNQNFSSINDIKAGDMVVVFGDLFLYNQSVYELNQGNYLVKHEQISSLTIETAPKSDYKVGNTFNPSNLVVTGSYNSFDSCDFAYANTSANFTFNPSLSTELTTSNDSITIGYGTGSVDFDITVEVAPAVISVTVTPETKTMVIGTQFTPTVVVEAVGGEDDSVTWGSSNENVATVDSETGEITAVAEGKATITATSVADSEKSDTCVVTVNDGVDKLYQLHSGAIAEGDYIITYSGDAMEATVSSSRFSYQEVTPVNNIITNPDSSIVWHIEASGDYWTVYNGETEKYAASTGKKSEAQLLSDGTDDKSLWTIEGTSTYDFVNKQNTASSVNATLRKNGTYGFACYATGTGGALTLYKKMANTPSLTLTPSTVTVFTNHTSNITLSALNFGTNSIVFTCEGEASFEDEYVSISFDDGVAIVTGISAVTDAEYEITATSSVDNTKTASATLTVTVETAASDLSYTKVTTAPADWRGTYLIVHESGSDAHILNAALESFPTGNYVAGTISNNTIVGSEDIDAAAFTIRRDADGGYRVTNLDGSKYLTGATSASGNSDLSYSDSESASNLVNAIGVGTIQLGTKYIRCNTNWSGKIGFRGYASESSVQGFVLYKMDVTDEIETEVSGFATIFLSNVTCSGSGSVVTDNWSTTQSAWSSLSPDAQGIIASTVGDKSGSSIAGAVGRYDEMLTKHPEDRADYMFRGLAGTLDNGGGRYTPAFIETTNDNFLVITIISLISVTAVGGYFLLRKKKED